ncbi:MAG: radical SAM protein [candidate division KSB1 bacterium]|nr:radical SAM protein [candidate division KSB1 bacterium]MDZ7302600.1 radical SAM protein [candidate division KSB1 bacterium]
MSQQSQIRRLQPPSISEPDGLSSGGYRHLFGPVHSRRLGLSLGIDVVPIKTCTFNCIYCQLGRTTYQTLKREEYVPASEVMAELAAYLERGGTADYLTFSGSGEPTLHSKLGEMIVQTKKMSKIPVAVLTCGALLFDPQVRKELMPADVVLPSLNAASIKTFNVINRPHGKLRLPEIIDGLTLFRREYRGQIWLEIMLIKGINDSAEEIDLLKKAIAEIKPDKVHLNTVVRPPAESEVQPLSEVELRSVLIALGPPAEIIAERPALAKPASGTHLMEEVVKLLARHPATLEEIAEYLVCPLETVARVLTILAEAGKIQAQEHQCKKFYTAVAQD